MNDCIFCKIAAGQIPADIVYEDKDYMAFRDLNPKARIHILIIPKYHSPNLAETTGEVLAHLPAFLRETAERLGVEEKGYRLLTNTGPDAGQEVFHLHFHLLAGEKLGDII